MSFQYILRRTIPSWSWQRNLAELPYLFSSHRIDELLVVVDTEEFSHGHTTAAWLENYCDILKKCSDICAAHNVRFSINPWMTVGHADRGRNIGGILPGVRNMIDIDGNESSDCACPLSSVWQENICKAWQIYASLHPYAIWLEDDIRGFGHGNAGYGCFCDLHLQRFAEINGEFVSREELQKIFWCEGEVHEYRKKYLQMMNDISCETVKMLVNAVNTVSPETNIGVMTSGPRNHVIDGRDWKEFFNAADRLEKKAFHRPTMGCYREIMPLELYYAADSIILSRHVSGDRQEFPEIENIPYTRYAKSAAMTGAEVLLCALCGCAGSAMNLYDHYGTSVKAESGYGNILTAIRHNADELQKSVQGGIFCGVRMIHKDNYSNLAHGHECSSFYGQTEVGFAAVNFLYGCGFSVTYSEDSPVTVITGETARVLNDNELETLLCSGKGVLLDGGAAKIICERNFGAEIGLLDIAEPHKLQYYSTAAAEEFFNPRYGGGDKVFVQAYVPVYGNGNSYSALTLADGAEAVSALCDYDANRLFIAGSMFVNSSGTRIFVHSMYWDESGACADIFSYNRVEMFRNVIKFLAGNTPVPMVTGDCPYNLMLMQKMPDDSMVAGVFNLSSDVCQQIELTIGKRTEFSFAEMLIDGKWCPVDILRSEDDILKAVVMCRSNLYAGMFFRFRR